MSNFHPLEVVGRGSETQLQASENLNSIILKVNSVYGICVAKYLMFSLSLFYITLWISNQINSVKLNDLDLLCFHRAG